MLPIIQVQCHAYIPGRDNALIFISSFQGESFGLRILETAVEIFTKSSAPICSPVKIQNACWWTKGRTNIQNVWSEALISKLEGRGLRDISRDLRAELWTLESRSAKLYSSLPNYDVSDEIFCVENQSQVSVNPSRSRNSERLLAMTKRGVIPCFRVV
jgi:hypothetical protein